jgi:hypothetical protein
MLLSLSTPPSLPLTITNINATQQTPTISLPNTTIITNPTTTPPPTQCYSNLDPIIHGCCSHTTMTHHVAAAIYYHLPPHILANAINITKTTNALPLQPPSIHRLPIAVSTTTTTYLSLIPLSPPPIPPCQHHSPYEQNFHVTPIHIA